MRATLRRELLLAAALLATGLIIAPLAVYWVGQQVVGGYEGDAGVVGLVGHIWSDLLALEPGAWALVSSPYVIVQLFRLAMRARRRRDVNSVTDPQETA